MKAIEFDILRREDGSSEFEEFLNSLPDKDAVKLVAVIHKTEQYGMAVAMRQQWVKRLRNGICELRSRQGGNIQRALYFHERGDRYIITHGFTKKTNKTPPSEIEKAERLMRNYEKGSTGL